MPKFPFFNQLDSIDCGPTCLKMISKYYGIKINIQKIRDLCFTSQQGTSLLSLSDAAESLGYKTLGFKVSFENFMLVPLPCIVHWHQNHFVVVYKIKKIKSGTFVFIADPAHGLVIYSKDEFLNCWISDKTNGQEKGFGLIIEPTNNLFKNFDEGIIKKGLGYLLAYLKPHKKHILQLILGLFAGSLLQLIFPFLTQTIVDFGISNQNLSFVYLVLIAQLVLFISKTAIEFLRSWILLHISTRINIALISDFLVKLMKLPMGFFDSKNMGDIMQRIGDHSRIEQFLTTSSLTILFSFVNLILFSIVLLIYSRTIFFIFSLGSLFYTLWIILFMKKRRDLDFKRFDQLASNQGNLIQMVTGMQEIKQNNCEKQKRWEWERIQARLFKVNLKSLTLNQYQFVGSIFVNETKNILISFLAAKSVIDGSMTLGMMLSVQYIIGQLNAPIEQMISFMQIAQDAKISFERLAEIHDIKDEEQLDEGKMHGLPENKAITLMNIAFQYEGPRSPLVLDNIELKIPQNKITAIVGASGSGKTTLMKLMLGYYIPISGKIMVGNTNLRDIRIKDWRNACGVVMQDGFIFSDTIARNISLTDEYIDKKRLFEAARIANIKEFVLENLAMAFNTKIGSEGHGLSQGQKQRILIARAVYKDPEFLFFDEATNALDANNEKLIIENLDNFFVGRTVVIIAHRLSTVKHAHQIVVLDKGKIVEVGNHQQLITTKGVYFELVRNQLELGT